MGLLALPRQLTLLSQALAPLGHIALDLHHEAMRAGLTRIILADRLVPSLTPVIAAGLVVIVAAPILSLADERQTRIWAVAMVGLAPLLIEGLGELAMTYLAAPSDPTPGEAVDLANRFVTGPLLFWRSDSPAPSWLHIMNARFNLITIWCVVLWAVGLRVLEGSASRAWHIAVPLTSLGVAGVLTWIGTPLITAALLGRP
jgi:hypothetical protein